VAHELREEGQLAEEDQLHLPTNEMVDVGVVALAVVEVLLVPPSQETEEQGIVDEIVGSMGRAEAATTMLPRLLGWTRGIGQLNCWSEEISADSTKAAAEDPSV
jgi:hypothetical protein